MDKNVCKICSKEFEGDTLFHKHLKTHKVTQTVYYQTHFPRIDLYDKSMIRYKNKEYYFSTDFNSKANFKKWLSIISPEHGLIYVNRFLTNRKEKKSLTYIPSQAELKTLMMPGIKYINEHYGDYDSICLKLGLKVRFTEKQFDPKKFKDISSKVIFTDTREQNPLDFNQSTRTKGMKFGDYRMAGSEIYIERKSVGDAWGTLTGGIDRFEREIIRAKDAGAYLVILIEGPFDSLEKYPMQRQVMGKIRIPVEFVYHNIRELMQKFAHIQFLFVRDRDEASRIVQKIFMADAQVRNVDLQFMYDVGKL